ncbi:MAG: Amuc_1099 family pilus-like system protein [Candidatus Methylacidiphilales bacterium]|nr:Amuc_1099 family pilus-like system protein [Candidatus Methylacidiphilales bacterium]
MQQPWERIILAASLAVLAIVSAGLAYIYPEVSTALPEYKPPAFVIGAEKKLADLQTSWKQPVAWNETAPPVHRMFTSERYWVFPDTMRIELVNPNSMIQGMSLKWLEDFKIDYKSSTVGNEDPDNDLFTNKEEFDAQTNPKDQTSHPLYISRLRLKDTSFKEFRLAFKSYDPAPPLPGKQPDSFYINLIDLPGQPSRRVKKGDNLEGYIIGDFRFKMVKETKAGSTVVDEEDRSELDIEKPEIKFKFTLIRTKQMNSPEVTAELLMLLPGQTESTFKVSRGGEFEIPQQPGKKYQLLGAKDEAVIYDIANKAEIRIPKATEEELKKYAAAPDSPTKPNP